MRHPRAAFFGIGAVICFAAEFLHQGSFCRRQDRRESFERHIADICVQAARSRPGTGGAAGGAGSNP
jgi:hypothetical protein